MLNKFKSFLKSDDGAVTVDWVVITAAVVGMAAIAFYTVEDSAKGLVTAAGTAVATEDDGFSKE